MKVSHIEHLGIAVKSLDEAIPYWENVLGLKCYAIEEVPDQKVRTAFFMLGQTKIELLEPTSEESTIAKYIENRGVGIHHMALACENIEEQLADAEAKGIRLIDAGHFPTENPVCTVLAEYLRGRFPGLTVTKSASHREVIQYYVEGE